MNLSEKSLFRLSLVVVFFMLVFAVNVSAAPEGGRVTAGQAEINQQGDVTDINQSTEKAAINWQKFGIKSEEAVNFNQPGTDAITLNRVLGNEKSVIDGVLNADGQVWLLNSNGVLFGQNAAVNTSGLLVTTKNLSNEDFMEGNYEFAGDSQQAVINKGKIDMKNAGYAVLLGKEVINEGLIKAELGEAPQRWQRVQAGP